MRARVRQAGHKVDKLSQEGLFGKMMLKLRQNGKVRQFYKDQGQGVPGKGKSNSENTFGNELREVRVTKNRYISVEQGSEW